MYAELQHRPFTRPLLVWMAGIALSAVAWSPVRVGGGLVVLSLLLVFSGVLSKRYDIVPLYRNRWISGVVILFLLFALSITFAHYTPDAQRPPGVLRQHAGEERQRLVERIDELSLADAEKSVLATLTLGYRQALPREVREKFTVTGVSHILAVSGFHVAVVAGFLSLLFSFLPAGGLSRWVRCVLLLALVWSFVYLSGLATSAVRAGVMFSFYEAGKALRRSSDSYNTLAASAFCMLVYRPAWLFDIGFQLSYLAVLSILYFRPRLAALISVRNPLLALPWSWITLTLAAQAGTLFLSLYYFGSFSVVFLYANLPVIFLANLLIPLSILWLLLPSALPGYALLQQGVEILTHSLLRVVDTLSSFPGASIRIPFDRCSLVASYAILLLILFYFRKKRPWMLLVALLFLFLMIIL